METAKAFWWVWSRDLPLSFDKGEGIRKLMEYWQLSRNQVFLRLKKNRFDMSNDPDFFWENFAIDFTRESGFFFVPRKYEAILARVDTDRAMRYDLSV